MYHGRNEEQWRGQFIFAGGVGMTLHIFRMTFALFIESVPNAKCLLNELFIRLVIYLSF